MILWKDRKRILGMPITFTVYSLSEDRLFIKIFEKKEDLLQLYNAVNNSDYQAADDLEITTLDTAACGIFQWTE